MRDEIQEKFPEMQFSVPLSRHCTFLVGGPADYFYEAKTGEIIPELISFARTHSLPYLIIGGGSNLLFDDEGFRGLVIKINLQNIERDNDKVTADAGVSVAELLFFTIQNGLQGLEKWIGLPGTVGGAVVGNAGCNGLETKDILISATILNPENGQTKLALPDYFNYSYRHSALKESGEIVLKATFQLQKSKLTKDEQTALMREIKQERQEKQPFGLSSGSFFKNPSPENPAGMLIDRAGLKGTKIGNAQISEKHGNFLLNLGGATSKDLKELARLTKHEVQAKFGIELQEEVQIISTNGKAKL